MERCTYDKNKSGPRLEVDLYSDACAFSSAHTHSSFTCRECSQCGQIRQISAAMRSGKKSQNWLSVADDDASALMFCSPWAAIDVDSGRLLFSEEPVEYYGLKQMERELQDCGDENADLPAEMW
jgi:hypothetical protein